jgi:hypothetical protein
MDVDFHYYATYYASRIAGFSFEDAKVIAYCAQLIDDNAPRALAPTLGSENKEITPPDSAKKYTFKPIATFQGKPDIALANDDHIRTVWTPFHFLPGNFTSSLTDNGRHLVREYTGGGEPSPAPGSDFRMLNRPHSHMAIKLINHCRTYNKHSEFTMHRIGVTMHVFADTWAHQDFAGTSQYLFNDAGAKVEYQNPSAHFTANADVKRWNVHPDNWKPAKMGTGLAGSEMTTPGGPHNTSMFYLGHGRMGTYPDIPFLIWKYQPRWSKVPIVRNNPIQYVDAFVHMVHALKCIKLKLDTGRDKEYAPISTDDFRTVMDDATQFSIIRGLILKCHGDGDLDPQAIGSDSSEALTRTRCKWWLKDAAGLGFEAPLAQWNGGSEWIATARAAKGMAFLDTDFAKFQLASKLHYQFVKLELNELGMSFNGGSYDDRSNMLDDLDEIAALSSWSNQVRSTLLAAGKHTSSKEKKAGFDRLLGELSSLGLEATILKLKEAITQDATYHINVNTNRLSRGKPNSRLEVDALIARLEKIRDSDTGAVETRPRSSGEEPPRPGAAEPPAAAADSPASAPRPKGNRLI